MFGIDSDVDMRWTAYSIDTHFTIPCNSTAQRNRLYKNIITH